MLFICFRSHVTRNSITLTADISSQWLITIIHANRQFANTILQRQPRNGNEGNGFWGIICLSLPHAMAKGLGRGTGCCFLVP